jgi:hypothetical protein
MIHSIDVSKSPCLRIGQDDCGQWIVVDRWGHCGRQFANSKDAIHFAMFESEQRPQAVIMGPRWLQPETEGAGHAPKHQSGCRKARRCTAGRRL